MLNALRRFASTIVGKIIGALLLVAMASFGVPAVLSTLNENTVVTVGSETITVQEFQRAYQQRLSQLAQQLGFTPSADQAMQLGVPGAVLRSLAADAAINQTAINMGLGVSQERLGKMLADDPSFASILGKFDPDTFRRVIRENGYTENEYYDLQSRAALRRQLAMGLLGGSPTSQAAIELVHRYQGDKRTVEYFTLDPAKLDPIAPPTDEELAAYLKDHQTQYRTFETRKVSLLQLTPDILAAQKTPTEDEVRAEYERTKDQLIKIETRQIQQVSLPTEAIAKWFEFQRDKGVSFADALAQSGLQAVDIGFLTKAQVTDSKLADAAFGLAKVGDFTVIPGIGSKRVVAVTLIAPGGQVSYEDAKADIAKRMALDAAKAEYADIQDQIEELRAAFKPLKEIADRYKLTPVDVDLTAAGTALSALPALTDEDKTKVAKAVFDAVQGKLSATVSLGANNNVYFELNAIELARDQTLDEVREAVTKAITDERTKAALEAEAKAIVADLDSGTSFGIVANQHDTEATTSAPIGRGGDSATVLTGDVATAIFLGGPNSHGWTVDGNGDYLLYHVKEIVPAEGDPDAQTKTLIEEATRDAIYSELQAAFQTQYPMSSPNQQALALALGLDTTQQ
ncbi:MAG: SurA N-terminal domain-containing protein [Devosia sp.]